MWQHLQDQAHQDQGEADLLFADNTFLVANQKQDLQCIRSCFADAPQLFGLEVRLVNTEVLHQPVP